MTPNEYQELVDYFIEHVDRYKEETRVLVQVSVESLRDEIRAVADGVLGNGRRIEENGRRIEENGRRIEENGRRLEDNGRRIDALTDRVGRLETTVAAGFADHEARLQALE